MMTGINVIINRLLPRKVLIERTSLSLTLFEKTSISQLLTEATEADDSEDEMASPNQLNLFDFSLGH